ncbi:MAG TPA: alpha/beta hydrolase [Chitinophagaceae bacterium]|nr:alpha/beta hydrolase [Chitinophagaceae bacterium]
MENQLHYAQLSNQLRIAYTDQGAKQAPTLVFIHGLANYHKVWDWNVIPLSATFRCIAIDLPGNGYSSRQDVAYSIDYFAKVLIEFLDVLKLTQVILVGHSMGGQIALTASLRFPERIDKMILFAPAGFEYYTPAEAVLFKSAITFGNFLNLDETHITQSITSSFYASSAISKKIIEDLNELIRNNDRVLYRKMLDACMNSMLDQALFASLHKIHQPVLVFFGENDMLIPNRFLHPVSTVDIARKACAELQNSVLVTYPETGHFVQIERMQDVNQTISSFLHNKL